MNSNQTYNSGLRIRLDEDCRNPIYQGIAEIARAPLLTPAQEKRLAARIANTQEKLSRLVLTSSFGQDSVLPILRLLQSQYNKKEKLSEAERKKIMDYHQDAEKEQKRRLSDYLPEHIQTLERMIDQNQRDYQKLEHTQNKSQQQKWAERIQQRQRRAAALIKETYPSKKAVDSIVNELFSGCIYQPPLETDEQYNQRLNQIRRWSQEYLDLRNQFASSNTRLVINIARKYQRRGIEFPDLVQEGTFGLIRAIEKFDVKRGYKFSTYAYHWIRQAILRMIGDQRGQIRIPISAQEAIKKIEKIRKRELSKSHPPPSLEEIAAEIELPVNLIRDYITTAQRRVVSINISSSNSDPDWYHQIADSNSPLVESQLFPSEFKEAVQKILRFIPPRNRGIFEMRFGLKDNLPKSLEEVALVFGLTREGIRQIQNKILDRLRANKEFVDQFSSLVA